MAGPRIKPGDRLRRAIHVFATYKRLTRNDFRTRCECVAAQGGLLVPRVTGFAVIVR